MGKGELLRI